MGEQLEEARRRRLPYMVLVLVLALLMPAFGSMAQAADEDFERIAPQEAPPLEGGGALTVPDALEEPDGEAGDVILPALKGIVVRAEGGAIEAGGVDRPGIDAASLGREEAEVRTALEPFLGKPFHQGDIGKISRAIVTVYREAGRPFVDVSFPPQDVTAGTVQVLVTEFRLGQIEVAGNTWFSEAQYRDGIGIRPGAPVEIERLKQGINQLNANPFRRVDAVLKPAGLENTKGIISASSFKEVSDPAWTNDPGVNGWSDFMDKHYPQGERNSIFNTYGYSAAELLVKLLEQCGDNLTRENVMKQAANLKNVELSLLLPGMTIDTSPTDYRVIQQFQMMRFNGAEWERFGPVSTH